MRKITLLATIYTSFFYSPLNAIQYDFNVTSSSGKTSIDAVDVGLSSDVESFNFNVSASDIKLSEKLNLSIGINSQYFDEEEIFFYDENKIRQPLKSLGLDLMQWNPNITLNYNLQNNLSIAMNLGTSLNNSVLKSDSVGLGVIYSLFNKSTVFSLSSNFRKQNFPSEFYNNENYQTIKISKNTQIFDTNLSVEQHITKNIKLGLESQYIRHFKNRSDSIGIKPSILTALNSRLFAKLRYELYRDIKNNKPNDGRGYLEMQVYHVGIVLEPIYDTLLSFSYDVIVEEEESLISRKVEKIGADQFGLGIDKIGEEIDISLKTAITNSSTYALGYQIEGGLSWRL